MAIRNHHARPRRSRRPAPSPVNLRPVIERPELYEGVRFMQSVGEQYVGEQHNHEKIGVWHLTYHCEYEDGRVDELVDVRQIIAGKGHAGRVKAIRTLQELMDGFGVARIILYHVRGPMTMEQVEQVRRMNEDLDQIKKELHETP